MPSNFQLQSRSVVTRKVAGRNCAHIVVVVVEASNSTNNETAFLFRFIIFIFLGKAFLQNVSRVELWNKGLPRMWNRNLLFGSKTALIIHPPRCSPIV